MPEEEILGPWQLSLNIIFGHFIMLLLLLKYTKNNEVLLVKVYITGINQHCINNKYILSPLQ